MIKDLCNYFRTRSVTYDNFLKNNDKLGQKIDVESRDFIPINFISKEIEDLGLSNILNDPDVCNSFPSKRLSKKYSNTDFRFTISHISGLIFVIISRTLYPKPQKGVILDIRCIPLIFRLRRTRANSGIQRISRS